jgi:CCR4-NOT transcription complex subunit 7/8
MTSKGLSSLGPTAAPATLSTSGYKRAPTTKPSPSPKLVPPKKAPKKKGGGKDMIVNVWADNLQEELQKIMDIVDEYPYIAMDTEFPGVVARPVSFKDKDDYHYQTLKCNVDLLKIIQLGLCFCDEDGRYLPGTCTWQFNFKFNLSEDMYAPDSIDLLSKSGIDFKEHDAKGINVADFGALLIDSGIVLSEEVRWISFHSGYDYGYLLKVLTCKALPKQESEFFELLRTFFPCIYDIKYLMKHCENLRGGLQKVAESLKIDRIGPQHQAGSDSLLTAATFFKIKKIFFEDTIDDDKYMGILFGLGQNLRKERKQKSLETRDSREL